MRLLSTTSRALLLNAGSSSLEAQSTSVPAIQPLQATNNSFSLTVTVADNYLMLPEQNERDFMTDPLLQFAIAANG